MNNIFDNNIFDVHSVEDIKDSRQINILEKKGENHLLFEFADDFFKYEDGVLTQYPDFVSLRGDKNGINATLNDYGLAIADSLNDSEEINLLKDFSLRDRETYIKENITEGLVSVPFKDVKKNMEGLTKNMAGLTKNLKVKELEDATSLVNAMADVFSLFYSFYKSATVANSKHKIVNEILSNLNRKKAESIVKNPELLREVPELKDVLKKYNDFAVNLKVDGKKFSDLSETEKINQLVAKAMGDETFGKVCDKIAESAFFKENMAKIKEKMTDISEEISNDFPGLTKELSQDRQEKLNLFLKKHSNGSEFQKFLIEDLKINPSNRSEQIEFLLANDFFAKQLHKNTSTDYDISIMRFISSHKDLDNVKMENVKNLVDKIAEKTLNISETKSKTVKI